MLALGELITTPLPKEPTFLLAALVASIFLLACGNAEVEAEKEIRTVVEAIDESDDPATCTELATRRFDEQLMATEGLASIKACEREVREPDGDPSSLAASEIRVQGATASLHLTIIGGTLDGQVLEVALIKQGAQWKFSEIRAFAELNRPKLIAAFTHELSRRTETSVQITKCVQTALKKASQSQLELFLFSGSTKAIRQLYVLCTQHDRPSLG